MVFEVFDMHPDNKRALFGGGRYNGLAGIFGITDMPGVGYAPGDESMKLFLQSWGLLENSKKNSKGESYYFPFIDENETMITECLLLGQKLRKEGKNVEQGMGIQKLGKAMQTADKK